MVTDQNNVALTKLREALYFLALGIFIVHRLFTRETMWRFTYSFINELYEQLEIVYLKYTIPILLICILLSFVTCKPDVKRLFLFGVFYILGKLVTYANTDVYFEIGLLLIFATYGIKASRIIKFYISLNVPLLLVTIIASQLGKIENMIDPSRNREYLGFTWTTTPVMIFSYMLFGYIVLKKGRIVLAEYISFLALDCWFYYKTNTRFAFLLDFLVLSFFLVYPHIFSGDRNRQLEKRVMALLPWGAFAVIYILSWMYNPENGLLFRINRLLSNRLKQSNYSLEKYGALPFGQPIAWVKTPEGTIDNPATYVDTAYLQTYLKFGVVSIVVLLLISSFLIVRAYRENRVYLAYIFGFILLFGLFEQQLYWFEYDVILMLVFSDWSSLDRACIQFGRCHVSGEISTKGIT